MWWNEYVGMPWKEGGRDSDGFDCWGLVRVIYLTHLGIELPRLDHVAYRNGGDKRELVKHIRQYSEQLASDEFKILTLDGNYGMFDILWLRNGGPIHFAVMIDDKRFVHIEEGCDAVVESISSSRWNNKIRGVFRHKSRA